ncbi:insulinase family protein [Pseudomonas sp. CDFA 553]|uniref:M16 family metallopeptidase n=1 Tax=Pseudomonas quasicaspiana TaxID=2829821 RepID=UPI001E2FC248|nr:pitrilysin family protein [Pseudomonas quasicaspiana]MCD5987529.1 insulinase family protein [Pseudomonas quasicaspiana]
MKLFIVGLFAPLFLCACASITPDQQTMPWDAAVVRGTLDNGLEYRLVRDTRQKSRLDIRLTVKAGSVDEEEDQIGVAHMLEHLVFYSHGGQPLDARSRMIAEGWVQGRNFNAMTAYDRTQYLMSPPRGAAEADIALQNLSTMLFAGDFSADDLDHERNVVIEEWRGGLGVAQRMNQQRTASQRVGSRYPEHRTIGNEGAIRSARLEALRAYQERWYQPDNMILSVVGDIEPEQLIKHIERWFGPQPGKPVPERHAHDLPLDNTLKIFQLQDSQSGTNQVALLLRMHEPLSRPATMAALRERMIDRFTLDALFTQLKRQPLMPGVRSLTAQKTQIGDYSSVLGIAAAVDGNGHQAALRQLLEELQRLQQYGVYQADLDEEKSQLRGLIERTLAKPESRTFEQWVNALNDAAVIGKVPQNAHAVAKANLHWIDDITLEDINQRLNRWLSSPDQVLQLSAPRLTPLTLPSVAEVEQLREGIRHMSLTPPQPRPLPKANKTAEIREAPAAESSGEILARREFAKEKVTHWQLSNGDRLVWLRRNGEAGRFILETESSAGFMAKGMLPWRVQMAAQLAGEGGPEGWSADDTSAWRKALKVNVSLDQQAERLRLSLSAIAKPIEQTSTQRLENLLQAYRMTQDSVRIDRDALDKAREDLLSRLARPGDDISTRKEAASRALLYGKDNWQPPVSADLEALTAEQLDADWQQLARSPVTYYLMADVPDAELEPLVRRELAGIPRGTALVAQSTGQAPGKRRTDLAIAIEPRATLQAQSFTEQPWTPAQAARVAALREMARSHLKDALRRDAAGIYQLTFDSQLNPASQRIESKLVFSTDPARVEELWQLARKTLAALPASVTEANIVSLRVTLRKQEAERRKDPATQLQRLILSERQWGDPRYLSEQHQLVEAIQIAPMKTLAGRLVNSENLTQLRLLPAEPAQ